MVVAETKRLSIRTLQPGDADQLVVTLGDPEVMHFSITGVHDLEDTRRFIDRCRASYEQNGFGPWALVDKESSDLVGFSGLSLQTIDDKEQIEIGYRVARRHWGDGLATEAAFEILDFGFQQLRLDEIIAIIEPENVPSIRVAEKVGFVAFHTSRFHGREVRIYRLTKPGWNSRH